MKSFRQAAAMRIAAAAAIGAAYVGWSGSAAVVAKRTQTAIVAVAAADRAGRLATDARAPDALGASDGCPFCLEGTDLAALDAGPPDILAQPTLSAGLADFDDRLDRRATFTPDAAAAPASEISTAAMATLGFVALTAARRRREGRPAWRAPWRSSTAPQSC